MLTTLEMSYKPFFLISRKFEDMKNYADNLGSNVAAMIKVRQVTKNGLKSLLVILVILYMKQKLICDMDHLPAIKGYPIIPPCILVNGDVTQFSAIFHAFNCAGSTYVVVFTCGKVVV